MSKVWRVKTYFEKVSETVSVVFQSFEILENYKLRPNRVKQLFRHNRRTFPLISFRLENLWNFQLETCECCSLSDWRFFFCIVSPNLFDSEPPNPAMFDTSVTLDITTHDMYNDYQHGHCDYCYSILMQFGCIGFNRLKLSCHELRVNIARLEFNMIHESPVVT